LSLESSFEDFQKHLWTHGLGECERPCEPAQAIPTPAPTPAPTPTPTPTPAPTPGASCHTAAPGEECYGHVAWAKQDGIRDNPEWYPNLSLESSFEDFQEHMWTHGLYECERPCVSCHTAAPGEECYGHVAWAMQDGIRDNPQWYPNLSLKSSFEDFQGHMWTHGLYDCARPCVSCHTAAPGEECYGHVAWAKQDGIRDNPEWYPNLSLESSFEDFQEHMWTHGLYECERPCVSCHTAAPGEECYGHVAWAMQDGIRDNPQWYPNLSLKSSFEDFQGHMWTHGLYDCARPCVSCHTAAPGEECYGHVAWAKQDGIRDNPQWYPDLSPESSFEDFQEHLWNHGLGGCERPCAP